MPRTETKYTRKRNSIYDENGKEHLKFPSISAAKKWSLAEQLRHGGRGNGRVAVDRSADPKPKRIGKRQDAADKFIAEALRKEQAERVAKEKERKQGSNTISLKYKINAQPESLNDVMVEKIRASQGLDARGRRKS